ncbi:MAG: nucleotidyl transferase AbiEii/AbiGii toxin family protein [Candidatus Diapherotrites archaeon]|nr:nucleotidyl transferase AbiEii/AbiGii toxin family protein [Candidatus Diapherotrites archaeon]
MISRDLIAWLADKLKADPVLVEKDLYLQGLLLGLSGSKHFVENYCFKGGTCLTKAHLGYYRFSEDLDFTWIHQERFEKLSIKQTQQALSKEIETLLGLFFEMAPKLGLDFKPDKHDSKYVNLQGRNRFVSFNFWYTATQANQTGFIKIQVNLLEKLEHAPQLFKIHAIGHKYENELRIAYGEQAAFAIQAVSLHCYVLEEIAGEKIRALLTRHGFKPRDLIDLYYLNQHGATIDKTRDLALKKIEFMNRFERFKQNLLTKQLSENIETESEERLLIQPLPKDFDKFTKNAMPKLNAILEKAKKRAIQKQPSLAKKKL